VSEKIERRSEDDNFTAQCSKDSAVASQALGFFQQSMTSSLQAIIDLTHRISKNEIENNSRFEEVFSEQKSIRADHDKIISLLDESQCRNDDGFSQVMEKLDTQEKLIDSLRIKEKKRSIRENIAKGVIYAFIISMAMMGAYATSVILFGEDRVQKVIDLKNGKVK